MTFGFGEVLLLLAVILFAFYATRLKRAQLIQQFAVVTPKGQLTPVARNIFQLVMFIGLMCWIWGSTSLFAFLRQLGHESVDVSLLTFGLILFIIPNVWELRLRVRALETRVRQEEPLGASHATPAA